MTDWAILGPLASYYKLQVYNYNYAKAALLVQVVSFCYSLGIVGIVLPDSLRITSLPLRRP